MLQLSSSVLRTHVLLTEYAVVKDEIQKDFFFKPYLETLCDFKESAVIHGPESPIARCQVY